LESNTSFDFSNKRGGKIPNKTLKKLKIKIISFQLISLILLTILYAVSIQKLTESFYIAFGWEYGPIALSVLISAVGIYLGLLFYGLSLIRKKIKNYIIVIIPVFIFVVLLSVFLSGDIKLFLDLLLILIKTGFLLILCSIPIVGCYGILKAKRAAILISGGGIIFFFIFTKIILRQLSSPIGQIEMLTMFFVLIIVYTEIATTSIYFKNASQKMTPNENHDERLISSFNNVINRYIIFIGAVFLSCYIFTFILFQHNNEFMNIIPPELIDIDFTSIYGIWFLITVTLIAAFIFWYLIPREKTKRI